MQVENTHPKHPPPLIMKHDPFTSIMLLRGFQANRLSEVRCFFTHVSPHSDSRRQLSITSHGCVMHRGWHPVNQRWQQRMSCPITSRLVLIEIPQPSNSFCESRF